jgi:crossover junction endodeoxyribonuclease RusA
VDALTITVPLVPPSVNHYVKHTRQGRHYVTREGRAFKEAVALFARGRQVRAKRYELEAAIYLGHGQRGDGDNFWKVIADGLVDAGVIRSDAAVTDWILRKRRDRGNPRTEITVRAKLPDATN